MKHRIGASLVLALLCAVSPTAGFAEDAAAPATTPAATPSAVAVIDKVVIHIDDGDAKVVNLALNNVQNILNYYKGKGETVQIEVVANGPGLQLLRQDTSPVKERIASLSGENPSLRFSACANTMAALEKQEGKKPELVSEAKVVPSGVVRVIELEKQGYAYVKP